MIRVTDFLIPSKFSGYVDKQLLLSMSTGPTLLDIRLNVTTETRKRVLNWGHINWSRRLLWMRIWPLFSLPYFSFSTSSAFQPLRGYSGNEFV